MQSNYCSAIDVGLFVYTSGHVKTCCSGKQWLGDLNKEPIQRIFKNPKYIEIRSNLRSNNTDNYCSDCLKLYNISPTASQKNAFDLMFPFQEQQNLKLIDIRWSDVCNLTCRYCNVEDSSSWKKLAGIPIQNVNKRYIESLFDLIVDNRETISNVYLLGGEPLLQTHNEKLLDLVKPDVQIDVLTNLTVKLENNAIYNKLKNFDRVLWNLSFDTIGSRFEYVRAGADWNVFQHNLELLKKDFGDKIAFHPVYSIWNAHNLREYYDFAKQYKLNVNWQLAQPRGDMYKTDSFIVFGHKKEIIDRAIQEIDRLEYDPALEDIKVKLQSSESLTGKSREFLIWTKKMEAVVPPVNTFRNLWPELYAMLDSN